jgi:asparagine synthase (glutamine-hydrolysing)
MAAAIAHRGPDDEGSWRSADGRAAFAHRRLAIIDLDARARQPLVDADGAVAVVFNGEIYNHADLRRQLRAAGHSFRTMSSDTEVLVNGYRAWGIDGLLSRLDGIFSFALHDVRADVTHLVRDRYGIKPLYVSWVDSQAGARDLLFASELRAILAHPGVNRCVDWRQVGRYLTFMSVPAPATMLEGIWKLPAGCRIVVAADGRAAMVQFQGSVPVASQVVSSKRRSDIVRELRATFAEVVEAQMIADVPVGVMLSGGLDSGAILALASRRRPGLDAYTIAYSDDPESDEGALAAETARRCGARHRLFRLGPEEALRCVDDVIAAMDEPQADWVCVPLWILAREVAANGTKAVLVGEGADELFVGYEHWRSYLGSIARWAAVARAAGPLSLLVSKLLARAPAGHVRWRTRADFLARAARHEELFWGGAILCWPTVLCGLWTEPVTGTRAMVSPHWSGAVGPSEGDSPAECVRHWFGAVDRACPQADVINRMIAIEFQQRLPELLLMRVDKMTMAHGVEARVPFLARAMVELAWTIRGTEKLSGNDTKALLREAFADLLPASVLAARKRGFGAPVHRWLRGPFGDRAAREILDGPLRGGLAVDAVRQVVRDHASGRANHAGILWALFILSRWMSISGARTGQ